MEIREAESSLFPGPAAKPPTPALLAPPATFSPRLGRELGMGIKEIASTNPAAISPRLAPPAAFSPRRERALGTEIKAVAFRPFLRPADPAPTPARCASLTTFNPQCERGLGTEIKEIASHPIP